MKRISGIIGLAAAALIASCGTGDSTGDGPSIGSATFSGAVSGGNSEVVIAIESDQSTQTHTFFQFSASSATIGFQAVIELGDYGLTPGTYTSASVPLATGNITVSPAGTNYGMVGGTTAGTEAVGSFTLTISSVGTTHTVSGVTLYYGVHGSLTTKYMLNSASCGTEADATIMF